MGSDLRSADLHALVPSTLALRTRLPGLDGFRGIAGLLIAAGHYTQRLGELYPGFAVAVPAGAGPTLFFLLSGFLLTRSLLNEFAAAGTIDVPRFYGRRLLRFAPAYFAFILAVWAFYTLRGFPWPAEKIVSVLLIAPNLYNILWDERALNVTYALWSLGVGVQFFLVWPLVLRALLKRTDAARLLPWMLGLVLLIGAVRSTLSLQGALSWLYLYNAPEMRMDALLIGCMLAIAAAARPAGERATALEHPLVAWGALVLLIVSAGLGSTAYLRSVGHSVNAALGGVVLWNIVRARLGLLTSILEWAPLRHAGVLAFSLLLWHLMAITLHGRGPALPPVAHGFIVVMAMLVMAAVSFVIFERPVLRRLQASSRP